MVKRKGPSWLIWFPLVAGIFVTPVVVRAASVLVLSGPGALTLLYPWAELIRSPLLNVTADIGMSVEQWAMYLQFPFYGLLMTLMMRKRSFGAALMVVLFLHLVCVAVVMAMAYLHSPNLRMF